MENLDNDQVRDAFADEDLADDVVFAPSGSCTIPTVMFWLEVDPQ